jgi:hypothetical protein
MSSNSAFNGILYEVSVRVDAHLHEEFVDYMTTKHIAEVLATGCFIRAEFSAYGADPNVFRTSYLAQDQAILDEYLSEFAGALRDDFLSTFPSGASVSRQIWSRIMETPSTLP